MMAKKLSTGARYWQLAALLAAVLPQLGRLPSWLAAAVALACLWRLPIVEKRIGAPGTVLRLLLLLAGMAGVFVSHRTLLGPEGGVSFLILAALLKMLESRTMRDAFISAVLDFFILATVFLFSQSLPLTLYVLVASVVVVAALLVLQQRPGAGLLRTLRRAALLAGQALPLMLVLFIFFPRLPPMWTLNVSQGGARTGMSDSMSPGDISNLSESTAVAFRVEFRGARPPGSQLYWRGLVFTYFDGSRWSRNEVLGAPLPLAQGEMPSWVSGTAADERSLRYRVILEPTDQPWLFALVVPRSPTAGVGLSRDLTLVNREPVFKRLNYEVRSWPRARFDTETLPTWIHRQALQLPAGGNPEARRLAQRWRNSSASPERYVQYVLDFFREERFFYTMEPPPLGEQRIDDFLFRSRRGFCEHYASSFVFLMRAAGIPARVVAGYQGGEQSPLGDYWLVRQMDAHAWTEIWLPGKGWITVDPTAAVAPQRIEQGAARAAAAREYWGESAAGALRHNNYRLLKGLRNVADYVNYRWQRDVLGYDSDSQAGLMQRLLGDSGLQRQLAGMVVALAVIAGLLLLWALRGERREQHPLDRIYRRYCARLARHGIVREAGESPQAYARRVARAWPELAAEAEEFARLYARLRYRRPDADEEALRRRLCRIARGRLTDSWRR